MTTLLKQIYQLAANFSSVESDSSEVRFQKSLLTLAAAVLILMSLIWGSVYYIFGEQDAAFTTIAFSILSLINLAALAVWKKFTRFEILQLLLILVFPFVVRALLGGYVNGSAVILWAFIAPMGALLLKKTGLAYWLLAGFIGLTVLSGAIDRFIPDANHLPQAVVLALYLLNIIMVTGICFALISYYFQQAVIVKEQLKFLQIHIDQAKRQKELSNITQSEFFLQLEKSVKIHKSGPSLEPESKN